MGLVYVPRTNAAINISDDFVNPGFDVVFPGLCSGEQPCPAGQRCLVASPNAEFCGGFNDNRTIEVQHQRLIRLNLIPGTRALPAASGQFDLFSGGTFGPMQRQLTPEPGQVTVTREQDANRYDFT